MSLDGGEEGRVPPPSSNGSLANGDHAAAGAGDGVDEVRGGVLLFGGVALMYPLM